MKVKNLNDTTSLRTSGNDLPNFGKSTENLLDPDLGAIEEEKYNGSDIFSMRDSHLDRSTKAMAATRKTW